MTKQDKDLLLRDLSARLPYGVKITWDEIYPITCTPSIYNEIWLKRDRSFKLYLRPMSSMTEDERCYYIDKLQSDYWSHFKLVDWLNKNHFDYRGLIKKGLAIEVTDENNPYK